jgi:hypothetical protein
MPPNVELPVEIEIVQPVVSVSGAVMFNRVTRQPIPGLVDSKGQPIQLGAKPRVIEIDQHHNEQTRRSRSDGVNCHLVRKTLPPMVEAPSGYFLTEHMPSTTRHTFERDTDGRLIGAAVEHGPPRKQQTEFGVS